MSEQNVDGVIKELEELLKAPVVLCSRSELTPDARKAVKAAILYLKGDPIPGEHCGKGDDYRPCEAPELCVPANCCFRNS